MKKISINNQFTKFKSNLESNIGVFIILTSLCVLSILTSCSTMKEIEETDKNMEELTWASW